MSKKQPVRGYALTPWSRGFLAVVDQPGDVRRVNKARSYFRDRQVLDLQVRPGRVSGMVQGSQLDPFEVTLTIRTVDAQTVVDLLRQRDATDELMAVARGEQPKTLGELIIPTESADVAGDCSCPDEAPRCIHVLAVAYEFTTVIDDSPGALMAVMGADTSRLLALIRGAAPLAPARRQALTLSHRELPPLPTPDPVDPIAILDAAKLTAAFRASGTAQLDVAEAIDELAELYGALTCPPPSIASTPS